MSSQITALCAVTSFLWLIHSLEGHQIIEQPRLSSLLILLIAGLASYAISYFADWLPGANGRYDDELGPLKGGARANANLNLPRKPRRYFLLILVVCIVVRFEAFHRVTLDMQCSKSGVEAWLPLAILACEFLQMPRLVRDEDDPEEFQKSIFEFISDRISDSRVVLVTGTLLLSWGAYLASSQEPRSTFLCSVHDRGVFVVFVQFFGLALDAAIAIIIWRILAWARTTKSRLKTLSGILISSSFGMCILYWLSRSVWPSGPASFQFRGVGSLYFFDIVVDGLTLAVFLVSTSFLATEGTALSFVGIVTFTVGLLLGLQKAWLIGTWENTSPSATYFSLLLLCIGFSAFTYSNDLKSMVFLHRAFVVILLAVLAIAATIYIPIKASHLLDTHPLSKIVYDSRIAADRWLVHASYSDSLPVAVQEYLDRHNGRDPPANFDAWYHYAKVHNSPIIDNFAQMEKDILPFWGMPPAKIREGIRQAVAEPDMAMLKIHNGTVKHNLPPANAYRLVMEELVDLVKDFVEHLPDMELAINMDDRPRVLLPLDDVERYKAAGQRKRFSKLLPRTIQFPEDMPEPQLAPVGPDAQRNYLPVAALRELTALTCPIGTAVRSGVHWDIRDVCESCVNPQSVGQFLTNWPLSQDICHQSDLLRLHSFHITPAELRPTRELLPVFSRSKTDSYNDILLPLRRINQPSEPSTEAFDNKIKKLYWRAKVDRLWSSRELVRGGHQERLVHTVSTSVSPSEKTRILLPSRRNHDKFSYQEVSTRDLNTALQMDIGFTSYSPCRPNSGHNCDAVRHDDFGTKVEGDLLHHQYVMCMDTDHGPSRDFLSVVRSSSVPFYASVFKEWYSERLLPWIHFVPVDLRFHGLHSTLAYFTGIQKKPEFKINGREVDMKGRLDDAKWIAEQGKQWAGRALRKEDMQVYLFRLLLEWGRVIDDKRDEIGFVLSRGE
ncbi:hypothetical protein QBC38DRAFT_471441 [Podospora fimiseda]|uniref:Glycosyltransferase Family 90 n=1 Tax=Podospora fimiseda TaxID=252190 RepID=A0AAN7BU60_9PEZI|nr:hypothetical protein QBC38DRAFT_471441 [Podospora fimiseda]